MYVNFFYCFFLCGGCLLVFVVLLGVCGGYKQMVKVLLLMSELIVEIYMLELDGWGSYCFLMSDGDRCMSVDEFDVWMKVNGICVVKGNVQDCVVVVVVVSKEMVKDKKKKK